MALSLSSQASLPPTLITTTWAPQPTTDPFNPPSTLITSLIPGGVSYSFSFFFFFSSSSFSDEVYFPATDTTLPPPTPLTSLTTTPSGTTTCDAECQRERRKQQEEHVREYEEKVKHHGQEVGRAYILAIALPICIVVGLVLVCCGYCCWKSGSGGCGGSARREKKRAERKGVRDEGQELGALGGDEKRVKARREKEGQGQGMGEGNAVGTAHGEGGNLKEGTVSVTTVKGGGVSVVSAETLVNGNGTDGKI